MRPCSASLREVRTYNCAGMMSDMKLGSLSELGARGNHAGQRCVGIEFPWQQARLGIMELNHHEIFNIVNFFGNLLMSFWRSRLMRRKGSHLMQYMAGSVDFYATWSFGVYSSMMAYQVGQLLDEDSVDTRQVEASLPCSYPGLAFFANENSVQVGQEMAIYNATQFQIINRPRQPTCSKSVP